MPEAIAQDLRMPVEEPICQVMEVALCYGESGQEAPSESLKSLKNYHEDDNTETNTDIPLDTKPDTRNNTDIPSATDNNPVVDQQEKEANSLTPVQDKDKVPRAGEGDIAANLPGDQSAANSGEDCYDADGETIDDDVQVNSQ